MDTKHLKNKKNVKMIAHRGCSGLETENTIPAFVVAGNRTYFGIETDVHITKDGKYVVIHDDDTKRVSKMDLKVEESNFDDLRKVPLSVSPLFDERIDLRIPTLEEYISVCKKYGKIAVLELKNPFKREEVFEICDIIKSLSYMENVIFISFDFQNLLYLREKYKEQPAQYLFGAGDAMDALDDAEKNGLGLDVYYKILTKELGDECRKRNIPLNCWTVDTESDAEFAISCGVDFITSNILE